MHIFHEDKYATRHNFPEVNITGLLGEYGAGSGEYWRGLTVTLFSFVW